MNNNKAAHVGVSIISCVIVLVVFSSSLGPLPPLGNFLNPTSTNSIFGVGLEANYPTNEVLSLPQLKADVTIYRDTQGIPHIYAQYDSDMFFAVGYVQAQDRLFQLDIQRREFSGNLSEILGNETLSTDIFFRSVGLERSANEVYNAIKAEANGGNTHSGKLLEALNSYTAGINEYIDENHPAPFEFQLIGYNPTHWNPVDSIAFAKFMSYYLGFGEGENDLQFAQIVQQLGADKAYNLFPNTQALQIPVIPDYGGYKMPAEYNFTSNGSTSQPLKPYSNQVISKAVADAAKNVDNTLQSIFSITGAPSEGLGSNNWVVSGSKTKSGYPMVSNDMHLTWSTPAIWYQINYFSAESGFADWGFMFIGSPFIVAGHNEKIAWGFTNVGGDVLDFVYFKTNSQGQYLSNGTWKNFGVDSETIKVKGSSDYKLNVQLTDQGPILPGAKYSLNGTQLAVSWTGIKTYEQLGGKAVFKAVYDFNLAQNYTAFRNAVYEWDGPSQNIVYGDVYNNIALWVAGEIPLRGSGDPSNGRLPVNGSVTNSSWVGYVPAQDWPHSLNPAQGYLASNNQISVGPNYPYYIGSYQSPSYRARRINFLLNYGSQIDVPAMEKIQTDVYDTSAEAFIPFLLDAIANHSSSFTVPSSLQSTWDTAVNLLKNWNYYMYINESQPLIFEFYSYYYLNFTFNDEYQKAHLTNSIMLPNLNTLENMTWLDPTNSWFDNVSTSATQENAYTIELEAFARALQDLQTEYGPISDWSYGKWHLGAFDSLARLSALSPSHVPVNGSSFTLNRAGGDSDLSLNGLSTLGSSERAIYDLSNLANSVAELPGGQSGNPVSPHYHDLLDKYFLTWKYYTQLFYTDKSKFPTAQIESTLILRRSS